MADISAALGVDLNQFNIMSALFRQGLSANYVQGYMQDLGMGLRRSTVQAVRRTVLGFVRKEERVLALPGDMLPNKSQITEMYWEKPYFYKVYGTVDALNNETGEIERRYISGYFEHLGTKDAMMAELYERLIEGTYVEDESFEGMEIKQIQHLAGAPY